MIKYGDKDLGRNSVVDIAFFVGADPTDTINNILKGKKYAMMSVHPSFMASLNKEFNLNLHVADFHGKYDSTEGINTVGTFAFLIASREIQGDDIASILKKIRDSVTAIHKSLIKLPPGCNDSCYAGTNDKCHFILPLAEFSFYQSYKATSRASVSDQKKAMVPFLIAIAGFFIPILKSVFKFKSVLVVWRFNRDIDRLLKSGGAVQEEYTRQLSQRLAVYYGNCEISDAQHNALLSRIENQLPHSGGLVTDTNKRHRIKRTQQREIDMSVQVHA
jgi:hypothetical protein